MFIIYFRHTRIKLCIQSRLWITKTNKAVYTLCNEIPLKIIWVLREAMNHLSCLQKRLWWDSHTPLKVTVFGLKTDLKNSEYSIFHAVMVTQLYWKNNSKKVDFVTLYFMPKFKILEKKEVDVRLWNFTCLLITTPPYLSLQWLDLDKGFVRQGVGSVKSFFIIVLYCIYLSSIIKM